MDLPRIKQLREALEDENIDLSEIAEIEAAYKALCDSGFETADDPENAMASDMLDELETVITPIERSIYDYVVENYGESEANDPSWAIGLLAAHLNEEFDIKCRGKEQ